MWSRDALEQYSPADGGAGVRRIHVVAHGIGTMLTMEALRRFTPPGQAATTRISAVIFASPDIDMDVFSSSVERIGPLATRIANVHRQRRALACQDGSAAPSASAQPKRSSRLRLRVIGCIAARLGISNAISSCRSAQIRDVIRRAVEGRPIDGA